MGSDSGQKNKILMIVAGGLLVFAGVIVYFTMAAPSPEEEYLEQAQATGVVPAPEQQNEPKPEDESGTVDLPDAGPTETPQTADAGAAEPTDEDVEKAVEEQRKKPKPQGMGLAPSGGS